MAREVILATGNFNRRDGINSKTATPMQEVDSKTSLIVKKAAILKDEDPETGLEREVGVIATENEYYTCISATIIDVLPDLIAIIDEEGECEVAIKSRQSKANRTFLTLHIY